MHSRENYLSVSSELSPEDTDRYITLIKGQIGKVARYKNEGL